MRDSNEIWRCRWRCRKQRALTNCASDGRVLSRLPPLLAPSGGNSPRNSATSAMAADVFTRSESALMVLSAADIRLATFHPGVDAASAWDAVACSRY